MKTALKWFRQRQNNSRGEFHPPAQEIWIEAVSEDDAEARLNFIAGDLKTINNCACCGDRWGGYWEEEQQPPEVAEISYLSIRDDSDEVPFAKKYAMGDDAGVRLPTRKQTREEYDAVMARLRSETERMRSERGAS